MEQTYTSLRGGLQHDQAVTARPLVTANKHSTSPTMPLSSCSSSFSHSSLSGSFIDGGTDFEGERQTRNVTFVPTIRKRCRMSDLQQHSSLGKFQNEPLPVPLESKRFGQPPERRCVSVNAAIIFTTADRYIAHRSQWGLKCQSYRTSKPPSALHGRELYIRSRDNNRDPFITPDAARSRQLYRGQRFNDLYQIRTPHHIPSFVYGADARVFGTDFRPGAESLRQLSWSGLWTVGGSVASYFGQLHPVLTGTRGSLASGTNAPMHTPAFLGIPNIDDHVIAYENRLALALNIDQAVRILQHNYRKEIEYKDSAIPRILGWRDGAWTGPYYVQTASARRKMKLKEPKKNIPNVAFRVLDAPHLKDDFYCSILAYSFTSRTLAVALTHKVYLWTEEYGVRYPPLPHTRAGNFVTSLSFSSEDGGKSILAVAQHDGYVTLWSLLEARPRFEASHPFPACCVSWRPQLAFRQSCRGELVVPCEDLLVGDDNGRIYYYSVEWPDSAAGAMILLVKLDAHSQNICGLAWAPDGDKFASGGNDNIALLFEVERILRADEPLQDSRKRDADLSLLSGPPPGNVVAAMLPTPPTSPLSNYIHGTHPNLELFNLSRGATVPSTPFDPLDEDRHIQHPPTPPMTIPFVHRPQTSRRNPGGGIVQNAMVDPTITGKMNMHSLSFYHSAAVKAIAFAPWQPNLLATGGGSNDRQIHFHHAGSGSTLAIINVFAQVTSLTWSVARREIVATFGYAQPEHDIRIAVFSWPSCECVVSIPWERKLNGEISRALWAVPYPGGPNDAIPSRRQSSDGYAA